MDKILINQVMTPDGTIIASRDAHDFRSHSNEKNEMVCFVDGGKDYLRRGGVFTEMSIYDNDPFEVIRRFFCRVNIGKEGDKKSKYTPLYLMDDDWLDNVINHNFERGLIENNEYYVKEKVYRNYKKFSNIKFPEVEPTFDSDVYLMFIENVSLEEAKFIKPEFDNVEVSEPTDLEKRVFELFNKYSQMSFDHLNDTTPFDVLNEVSK